MKCIKILTVLDYIVSHRITSYRTESHQIVWNPSVLKTYRP